MLQKKKLALAANAAGGKQSKKHKKGEGVRKLPPAREPRGSLGNTPGYATTGFLGSVGAKNSAPGIPNHGRPDSGHQNHF